MAITIPVIFTPIQDAEVKYTRSVTEETVRKMVQDCNMLGKLSPIGSVRAIQINQTGVQAPDSTIFQLMDGSEITFPDSPLRSVGLTQRFTPDMTGLYVRGAPNPSANNIGGSATIDLSHTHSIGNVSGSIRGEEGDEKTARVPHSHPLANDLASDESLELAHQRLAFYLKIT